MKTILSIVFILSFGLGRAQQAPVFDVEKYVCKLTPAKLRSISVRRILVVPGCGRLPTHKHISITSPASILHSAMHPTVTEYPVRTLRSFRICEESNIIETDQDDPRWIQLIYNSPETPTQRRTKELYDIRNRIKRASLESSVFEAL